MTKWCIQVEDPLTGETIEKPMVVTGQLSDEMGNNLSERWIRYHIFRRFH